MPMTVITGIRALLEGMDEDDRVLTQALGSRHLDVVR